MYNLRKFAIALVSVLLSSSFSIANDGLDTRDSHVAGTHKTSSEVESLEVDYFNANWALFTGDDQNSPEIDAVAEIASKYFDANWALFKNKEE